MKNQFDDQIGWLCVTKTAGELFTVDTNKPTFQNHDSVIVSTLVVKENGESLLIKFPETTSWFAEPGNILLPAVIRVFPVPFGSSKKVLQVRYSNSYTMSFSYNLLYLPSPLPLSIIIM